MPFSDDELFSIRIATVISSVLSAIGSAYVILSLYHRAIQRSHERYVFTMAIVSLVGSFAFIQSNFVVGQPLLCTVQASLIEFTVNTLPLLGVTQAVNFWAILSDKEIPKAYDGFMIMVSILMPTLFVFGCLWVNALGDSLIWCWIVKSRTDLRYGLFYIPLWVNIFLCVLFTFLGVRQVFLVEKRVTLGHFRYTATASRAFFYGLAFIVTWIPGTTNRLYENLYGSSPFILILLHTTFTPLQGFLNAMVYFSLITFYKKKPSGRPRMVQVKV